MQEEDRENTTESEAESLPKGIVGKGPQGGLKGL